MEQRKTSVAWILGLLFAINTMNFFDRQIPAVVAEPIRREWGLSDTALGWLGTAFILLYALVGLPIGRLADTWSRTRLLSLGVFVWSFTTFLSGLAGNFWTLVAGRLGVGIGEAVCAPCATSLIGDLFPPERRARATSVFMFGLPLGVALSSILSGWVAQTYGWRVAFYLAALPGFLLSLLMYRVREPLRGTADGPSVKAPEADASAYRSVLRVRAMLWIIVSGALHNFNLYALSMFVSPYLIRFHGLSVRRAGFLTGIVFGGAGALGMFLGGLLSDRAVKVRPDGRLLVASTALLLSIPTLLLALAQPQGALTTCVLFLLPGLMTMYMYYTTVYATIQDIIPPALRGRAMALYFCAMYLLGAALGPVGTGFISDRMARQAADALGLTTISEVAKAIGLRHALFVVPALCLPLALVLFMGARAVRAARKPLPLKQAAGI